YDEFLSVLCVWWWCGGRQAWNWIILQLGYLVGSIKINAVGGWRDMYRLSASIAVLMGLSMFSLPPSPRWLLLRAIQGKASVQEYKEKTIQGLSKLRGRPSGDKVSQKQIEDTPISLKSAYAADDSEGSFWECFKALV
ncbi:hypothetical protein GIB67_037500, partial [Kingdonia uniflora]